MRSTADHAGDEAGVAVINLGPEGEGADGRAFSRGWGNGCRWKSGCVAEEGVQPRRTSRPGSGSGRYRSGCRPAGLGAHGPERWTCLVANSGIWFGVMVQRASGCRRQVPMPELGPSNRTPSKLAALPTGCWPSQILVVMLCRSVARSRRATSCRRPLDLERGDDVPLAAHDRGEVQGMEPVDDFAADVPPAPRRGPGRRPARPPATRGPVRSVVPTGTTRARSDRCRAGAWPRSSTGDGSRA